MRRFAAGLILALLLTGCTMPTPREELIPTAAAPVPSVPSATPVLTPSASPAPTASDTPILSATPRVPAVPYAYPYHDLVSFKQALPPPLVAPVYLPERIDPGRQNDLFFSYAIDYADPAYTQLYGYTLSATVAIPSYGDTQLIQGVRIVATPSTEIYAMPGAVHGYSLQNMAGVADVGLWCNWEGEDAPPEGEQRAVTGLMEYGGYRYEVCLHSQGGEVSVMRSEITTVLHSMLVEAYRECASPEELAAAIDFGARLPASFPTEVDPTLHQDVLTSYTLAYATEDRLRQSGGMITARIADGSRTEAPYDAFSFRCAPYPLSGEGFPVGMVQESVDAGGQRVTVSIGGGVTPVQPGAYLYSCAMEYEGTHYLMSLSSRDIAPGPEAVAAMRAALLEAVRRLMSPR